MRAKNPKATTPPTLAESAIPPRADDVLMTPAALLISALMRRTIKR